MYEDGKIFFKTYLFPLILFVPLTSFIDITIFSNPDNFRQPMSVLFFMVFNGVLLNFLFTLYKAFKFPKPVLKISSEGLYSYKRDLLVCWTEIDEVTVYTNPTYSSIKAQLVNRNIGIYLKDEKEFTEKYSEKNLSFIAFNIVRALPPINFEIEFLKETDEVLLNYVRNYSNFSVKT